MEIIIIIIMTLTRLSYRRLGEASVLPASELSYLNFEIRPNRVLRHEIFHNSSFFLFFFLFKLPPCSMIYLFFFVEE